VVRVDARAAADDIEYGVYVVGGTVDEAILGSGMATRDGLAGDLLVSGSFDGKRRLMYQVQRYGARGVIHGGDLGSTVGVKEA